MCKGTSEGEGQQQCVCLLSFLLGNNLCSSMRHHCLSLCSAPFFPPLKAVLQWPTCIFVCVCVCVCVCAQSLSHVWLFMTPMDGSPPGSSVYGIFQARLLEWIVISSSRGFCRPRGRTCISWVSCIDRRILYHCSSWEPLLTTWIEMIYFLKNLILVFALLFPLHPPI